VLWCYVDGKVWIYEILVRAETFGQPFFRGTQTQTIVIVSFFV